MAARAPRSVRFWTKLCFSAAAGLLLCELGLRLLLFGEGGWIERWGGPLRDAGLYAHWTTEEHRTLEAVFAGERGTRPHPHFDPLLGWIRSDLAGDGYRSAAERELGGRRPVLFYGDSFTECTTPPENCWEGLFERSAWAEEYGLVNFGVGGFGVDQTYLLARSTIRRFLDRDPVVWIGILVDEDLDRTYLGIRRFPKPRPSVEDGRLRWSPPAATPAEYAAEHPPDVRSYLWRFALFGTGVVPHSWQSFLSGGGAVVEAKQAVNRLVLDELRELVEGYGLEYQFVLFHGPRGMHEIGPYTWRERFLYAYFREHDVPFVTSKRPLLEDMHRTGRDVSAYFIPERPGKDHYVAEANAIVFPELLRGLAGYREPYEYLRGAAPHPRAGE